MSSTGKVDLLFGFKVGDKSLINPLIGLHEVPAKLNFEGETSEVSVVISGSFFDVSGLKGVYFEAK